MHDLGTQLEGQERDHQSRHRQTQSGWPQPRRGAVARQGKSQRRHRDKTLHSNAVRNLNWNGAASMRFSPYPLCMVGLKYTPPIGTNPNPSYKSNIVSPPALAAPTSRQPTLNELEAQVAASARALEQPAQDLDSGGQTHPATERTFPEVWPFIEVLMPNL